MAAPSYAGASTASAGAVDGADPYLGRTIAGKFQILDLLGQGGMGKVYRAKHVTLDKIVCIKTLRPALLEDPTIVGRFEREAKSASRLNHANSIQVLDFGQDEFGALYIAMEFVSGKDLRKTLRDEFPLGEERICHIIAQVLSALAEAHAQHVIHRDLKPENIMLEQRRGEPDYVKVLDFGIAKIQDPDVPGLTRADVVCGTPLYMSPEQATGSKFDHRADLYAVGVILYQLCTGTLPFDGQNSMEILTKHVTELPIPPRTRRPEVSISPDMEALILRAMDKDPANRPASAEEFRAELLKLQDKLKRAREDAETAARQASTAHKAERAQALKEKQAAQLAQMTGATTVAAPPPARSKTPLFIAAGVGVVAIIGVTAVALRPKSTPSAAPAPSAPTTTVAQVPAPPPPPVPTPAAPPATTQVQPVPAPPPPAVTAPKPNTVTASPKTPQGKETPGQPEKPATPVTTTVAPKLAPATNLPPLRKGDTAKAKELVAEADLSFEEGNFDEAVSTYRQAIKADPSYSESYYGLFRTGLTTKNKGAIRDGGDGFLRAAPNDVARTKKVRDALGSL